MQDTNYLYMGLKNGLKISKNKIPRNIVDYIGTYTSEKFVTAYETFQRRRKRWTLFRDMHTSISDKMQQEIISKGGNVFIFYHIALLDISQ